MRPHVLILILAAMATPAMADALDEAAVHAEPQYYLLSLPSAPVAEIAESVLGEAVGVPFKVDADVDAEMPFQIEGRFTPKALAREFGYRLWNMDVALVDKPSDGLWLIPKEELPEALSQGSALLAPLAGAPASAKPQSAASSGKRPSTTSTTKTANDWSWLAWLAGGWIGGVSSALAWRAGRRRPASAAPLSHTALSRPPVELDVDDLVIPVFAAPSAAPRTP